MWKNLKQRDLKSERLIFLSGREKQILVIKSVLVMVVINSCFYRELIAFLPLLLIGYGYYRKEERVCLREKQEETRQQFKEMLFLTVAGLRAGYSAENAFLKSYDDLQNLYGEESSICRMLRALRAGLSNHMAAADLWKSIGQESRIVEISEFAEVFVIAKESGGNMAAILESTAETIADKTETKKEIAVMMSARRLEQKIMNVMPFLLIFYINLTSPGYFDGLYGSVFGAVIMTGCLLVYLTAYLWGEKISRIEI